MKNAILLFFITLANLGFAQQDTTLVYNSPMYAKDPVRAKWRPVVKQNGVFYEVSFYDSKDVLQETISFEDKLLLVRQGPYVKYNNAKIQQKGNYDKGHKNGEWTSFYTNKETYTTMLIENYSHGKRNGPYRIYWPNSQLEEVGNYRFDKQEGNWKLYYDDGKLAGDEIYDEAGKKIKAKYLDKNGIEVPEETLFAKPSFEGGLNAFYQFISKRINYPRQMMANGIEGEVKISFTVKENGNLEDIKVIEATNNSFALEAIKVMRLSPNWIPGKRFGKTVNTRYNIPIKFALK